MAKVFLNGFDIVTGADVSNNIRMFLIMKPNMPKSINFPKAGECIRKIIWRKTFSSSST